MHPTPPNMSSESFRKMADQKPQRHSLFHPAIAEHRKQYLSFYFIYAGLLIFLMWALLPIYWASLAYTTQHTRNLRVWVIDRDQSSIGSGLLAAVQRAIDVGDSSPTLGWDIVANNDTSVDSNDKVIDGVVDEQVWAAVVINVNATNALLSAFSGSSGAPSQNNPAISVYYVEARNEIATASYIVPFLYSLLIPATADVNVNLTSQFLAANANNQSAIQSFANVTAAASASAGAGGSVTFEMINLRPFSAPVVSALTEVGMILICILSFILTMANSALRPLLSPHLSLPHYVLLRVFIPLLAYVPLSLSFATISLPFHVPFDTKYTEAQGFFLFWIICYILMGGLGLATEFAIGVLTIRFAPFFLLTLIISNVSITENPLELQPGIYRYGRGFPFYNASQAFRTIAFNTKSHLSVNVPVLIGWMLVSMLTVSISTWIIEGRNRRKGVEEKVPQH